MLVDTQVRAQLSDVHTVRRFMRAGRAIFTLKSNVSGKHCTYRVRANEQKSESFFVDVRGLSTERNFTFIGTIWGTVFRPRRTGEAPKVFEWFFNQLEHKSNIHPSLEIYHEMRCGRCGRTLTHPDSIRTGIGPECAKGGGK